MESSSSRRSVQFSTVQYRTGQNSTVQREERGREGLILMGEDKALHRRLEKSRNDYKTRWIQ